VKEGDEAPDFELPDQDGNPVRLSGLRGRPVVLYFYPKADTHGRNSSSSLAGGFREILRGRCRRRTWSWSTEPPTPSTGVTSTLIWR